MSTWNPKANEIFLQALELPTPDSRQQFLDGACRGDAALRGDVEALLAAGDEAGSFLESPAVASQLAATIERPIVERPGTVIGPYKLLEQIGEGGFGIVFMAEQQQPVRRKVALKLLKPGMDTRQVVARFEAERQALALMDHPNIAKVLNAGETDSGRPYFVMDLVRGVPITEYCDQNQIAPGERLELFVQVCQAVQHAHQKAIIHRDIKPSNVLISRHDGPPLVKVIDFGIAKALGQQLTDKTLFTNVAQLIGTPLYMSPEQAGMSELDIDTRSDIYSLGVLLYELLTGTTPFDGRRFKDAGFDEMRRIIREEEPPKPSTRISTLGQAASTVSTQRKSDPKRLSQLLRGELDWIAMKCLEKDRSRRYETANGLAMDVQRYLHHEPVLACPPSTWYRFRKFARRKRVALAMAACVLLALSGIAGGVGWAVRDKAAREEAIKLDRLARERALNQVVERNLDEAGPLVEEGKWPEALVILERTDQLLASAESTERPARLLEMKKAVAVAQRLEGIYHGPRQGAQPRLLASHPDGTNHASPPPQDIYDEAFFWGRQQDADFTKAFLDLGIDVETLSPDEAAEKIRRQSIRAALVRALDGWATFRKRSHGKTDSLWKKLIEIASRADGDEWRNRCRDALLKGDRHSLEELADTVNIRQTPTESLYLLGNALRELGALDRAIALLERAQFEYPGDLWLNDALAFSWREYEPPRWDAALRYYTAVLALRPDFSPIHLLVADALKAQKAYDKALLEYSKAVELEPNGAVVWTSRGDLYRALKRLDEASADYAKAIELRPNDAKAHSAMGQIHGRKGQWKEAAASLARAIEIEPRDHWSAHQLGVVLAEQGDLPAYQKFCDTMLSRWGKVADVSLAERTAKACLWLAGGVSDPERLTPLVQTALSVGENENLYLWVLLTRGLHDYRCGRFAEARTACRESLRRAPPNYNVALRIMDQTVEAMSLYRLGETDQARQALAAAGRLLCTEWPELDSRDLGSGWQDAPCCRILVREAEDTMHTRWQAIELEANDVKGRIELGHFYARQGQWKQAATAFDRALEIDPANRDVWTVAATAHAAVGDLEAYRRACEQIAQRFGDTSDKQTAERCAKACLLMPDALDSADFDRVQKLAELGVTGTEGHPLHYFFTMVKGLAEYRAGHYPEAIKWTERHALRADGTHYDAIKLAVIAMAQCRLGHGDQALAAFDKTRSIMAKMPDQRKGQLFDGNWHDWVHAQVLCREAEALLEELKAGQKSLPPASPPQR